MLLKLFRTLILVLTATAFISNTAIAASNPAEVCSGAQAIGLTCKECNPDCAVTFIGAVKQCTVCTDGNCSEDDCGKCSDPECVGGE